MKVKYKYISYYIMGIKSIKKLLTKKCSKGIYKKMSISQFAHKTIFIDTSIFMYKFKYFARTDSDMYSSFLNMIFILLKFNITPIFVFDGKPTENKIVIQERKIRKDKIKKRIEILSNDIEEKKKIIDSSDSSDKINNIKQIQNIEENEIKLTKLKKQNIKVTYKDINNLKKIFTSIGVNYFHAPYESDIIIPYIINKFNLDPLCLSGDTDFLPHKLNLLANFDINTQTVDIFNYKEIKEELALSDGEFVDMCVLMGCDYCKSLRGIGPMKSFDIIKKHKTMENYFENIKKKDIDEYVNARNMFINPKIEYEINKEKICLDKFNKEVFSEIANELGINDRVKNKIIKIRCGYKKNPITNYFLIKKNS